MNRINAILEPYEKEVDGALFLGIPIARLSTRQLRAALVMMADLYENKPEPQLIKLALPCESTPSESS